MNEKIKQSILRDNRFLLNCVLNDFQSKLVRNALFRAVEETMKAKEYADKK